MPLENLNVTLLPFDIAPFNTGANLAYVSERLQTISSNTNLVVLPEMFNSGFTTDTSVLSDIAVDGTDNHLFDTLQNLSRRHDVAIWGTCIARNEDDKYVNRGFMISPCDPMQIYDKRHTFSLGGESRAFARGSRQAPIVEFKGWRLKMAICYDIRFPVWNRSRANEYDALIVPANWVHTRHYPWRQLLIARAIENQAYVAGCNREGSDDYGVYERGDSLAFDFNGRPIGTLNEADGSLSVMFDGAALESARRHFAPWRDADTFTLHE